MRGRLITVEGLEGTGKTVLAGALANELGARYAKEPGEAMGGLCRRALLEHKPSALAQLFLMLADRREHVEHTIEPQLAVGNWVVADRFTDTTVAYQWAAPADPEVRAAMHHDLGKFLSLCDAAACGLEPDLILVLHASPDTIKARLRARAGEQRVAEGQDAGFNRRLQEYFHHTLPYIRGQRAVMINANGSQEEVLDACLQALDKRFGPRGRTQAA